jgi:hypothetical protein
MNRRLAISIYDEDPHRRAVNKRLTKDESRRMAVNFAKLPELKRLSLVKYDPPLKNPSRGYYSTHIAIMSSEVYQHLLTGSLGW